jgi:hypothetical protein
MSLSTFTEILPLGVASCSTSIQLVPYDAVNRNKVSIRQLPLYFSSHSLHVSCISNIDNTLATKKRQNNKWRRQKASTAHSSITTTLMD